MLRHLKCRNLEESVPSILTKTLQHLPRVSVNIQEQMEKCRIKAKKLDFGRSSFGLGVLAAIFTRSGGLIVSGWNIFDAFKAKSEKDPNGGLCIGVAVGGFLLILIWTIFKNQAAPNS
ncbi:MAG: hypothetical protein WCI55_02315 [Armatimonadota bacterium]